MELSLAPGLTLTIDGPAAVILLQGSVEILGNILTPRSKFCVRRGRRIPIESKEESRLQLNLGKDATLTEVAGHGLPETWVTAAERIIMKGGTALVLGTGDSGKTTFCTYLANRALRKGLRVFAIDGDLGQANIGPPTTLSMSLIKSPVIDLFGIRLEKACFLGVTSPSSVANTVIRFLGNLKVDAENRRGKLIIIDTDGWIQGDLARNYKVTMVDYLNPDFVVGIQERKEMEAILEYVRKRNVFILQVPRMVLERGQEDRLRLRERGYWKYLKRSTLRTVQLVNLKMEFASSDFQRLTPTLEYKEANFLNRSLKRGLLVGLLNHERVFMGLGIVESWDRKGCIQLVTPVKGEVSVIQLGRIILRRRREEGVVWRELHHSFD